MADLGARRWWVLGALMLAVLAVGLDGTVLSVALPTLAGALRASESDLQWFSSGYLLVLAAAMLPAGLLGDRYGRRKVMLAALALFGIGSVACAYAPTAGAFIAARVVLGLAGATLVVMALSTLTVLFDKEERPRAVGVWAAANFLALPIGPILGGWLLTHHWWGWVFLLNVPVALVGFAAMVLLVPESRAEERPRLDPVGVVSSSAGLVGVTYGLIEAGRNGWGDVGSLAWIAAGLIVLAGFFLWERRLGQRPGGQPLIDVALFRLPAFTWGVVLGAALSMSMVGVLFTVPQYFQGVRGTDAMGSGLRLLPMIAGLVAGAVPADRIARLLGRKIAAALGFAVLGVATAAGASTGVDSGDVFVAAWMAGVGVGTGLALAATASAALSQLSAERSGVGSAVLQAVQKTGGPLGAAILGSVLSSAYRARLHLDGLPAPAANVAGESVFGGLAVARRIGSTQLVDSVRAAFVHGMDTALLVSAGISVASILLAMAFLPGRAASKAGGVDPAASEEPLVVPR
jgi:MFS transporter, DHA2 family, multidrug resistance protein